MKQTLRLAVLVAIAMGLLAGTKAVRTQGTRTGEAQFKAAQHKEDVEGDLKGAIEQYNAIAQAGDRVMAARALVRMAACYEKLGDAEEAQRAYERIVREFRDQSEVATEAQRHLQVFSTAPAKMSIRQIYAGLHQLNGGMSRDGRWVAFTDWNATEGPAVRDLLTGSTHVLTRPQAVKCCFAEWSVISPDARFVAYLWEGEPSGEFEVRIVAMDGKSEPRVVRRNRTYVELRDWTPDGHLLVTQKQDDSTWQIALLSVEDGSMKPLKSLRWSDIDATISPDGRFVAYAAPSDEQKARDIYLLATDGSSETHVVQHAANDSYPTWSADGSRLLFVSDRSSPPSLWSLNVTNGKANGEAELVKENIGVGVPLRVTNDGTLYYSVSGDKLRNIYRADLGPDGKVVGAPKVLTDRFVNANWGASLSFDGRGLAYYSSRPDNALVIRDLSSGQERDYPLKFSVFTGMQTGPGWLPDGRTVLIDGTENGRKGKAYYRMDLNTGEAKRTDEDGGGAFKTASDGKFIVSRQGGAEFVRLDLTTHERTVLRKASPDDALGSGPAISPDTTKVAYFRDARNGRTDLVVVSVSGGEPQVVCRLPDGMDGLDRFNSLSWTPDQRWLLFATSEKGTATLWRAPAGGGAAEQLGVSIPGYIKNPQISPDGRSLFFWTNHKGQDELWALEHFLSASTTRRR